MYVRDNGSLYHFIITRFPVLPATFQASNKTGQNEAHHENQEHTSHVFQVQFIGLLVFHFLFFRKGSKNE